MSIPQTPSPLSNIIAAKTYNAAWFSGSTKELQITAAIAAAVLDGALYVYVPASMLPYTASGVTFNTSVKMLREGGDASTFDVQAYGADPSGSADSTVAIQAAVNAAALGTTPVGTVYFSQGQYKVISQITCSKARTHLRGDIGPYGAFITFNPTGAATCFKFEGPHLGVNPTWIGNVPLYQCSIRNLGFLSTDTTFKKIAIDIVDGSAFVLDEITINNWNGAKSIGIRFAGRDMARFRNLSIYADKPFQFISNIYKTTLSMDHIHISDTELVAQDAAEYVFDFQDNMGIANFTVDGRQAWAGGSGAIKFNPTTLPTPVLVMSFQNVRYESPQTFGLATVDLGSAATTIRNILFINCNFGGIGGLNTNKGVKLRGVFSVAFINCIYTGGNVGLDVDSSVHDMWHSNFVLLDNTTPSVITGMTAAFKVPTTGGYALPPTAYYTNDTDVPNGTNVAIQRLILGAYTVGTRPTSAAGSVIYVSDGGAGAVFQGWNGAAWVNLG